MKRILSMLVTLILVMGTVSAFAATADWNGYFIQKYRYKIQSFNEAGFQKQYENYIWQKLELYPTWTLSDNVKVGAGFFTQNYWGTGRLYGIETGEPIQWDNGSYTGSSAGTYNNSNYAATPTGGDALARTADPKGRQQYNPNLGVSAAFVKLSFMEGKLGIDAGHLKNSAWGTGAFFGTQFTPDRIFISYKTPMLGGVMIPYFIYEFRDTDVVSYKAGEDASGRVHMVLFGDIYLKPGKTLAAFVINPVFVGKDYSFVSGGKEYKAGGNTLANGGSGTYGTYTAVKAENAIYTVTDLYIDHKITLENGMTIKPIFEITWAFGEIDHGTGVTTFYQASGFSSLQRIKADILNFILKAEISLPKLATFIPEFGWMKSAGQADKGSMNFNVYGVNEFCGGEYRIGQIFNGLRGGYSIWVPQGANISGLTAISDIEKKIPGWWYVKLRVNADVLGQMVTGLNGYVAFIMAGMNSSYKTLAASSAGYFQFEDTNKSVITEIDLGASYAIDSSTTFSIDLAWAKWGSANKDVLANVKPTAQNAGFPKRSDIYVGADLKIKF